MSEDVAKRELVPSIPFADHSGNLPFNAGRRQQKPDSDVVPGCPWAVYQTI